MYPYIRNEKELSDFHEVWSSICAYVWGKWKVKVEKGEKEILKLKIKAVKPLLYAIECEISNDKATDEDVDKVAEKVSRLIQKIGADAIPDVEYIANHPSANVYVNEFAKELCSKLKDDKGHGQ